MSNNTNPSTSNDPFVAIESSELEEVAGGAARVASGGSSGTNDQLTLMLTQIGESIKDLARNNSNSGSGDMTQMMMMMMMMGGMGGGGGAVAAAPVQQPTYVEVTSRGGCGKKGW